MLKMYMLVMLKTMLKTVLKYEKNHRHIHFFSLNLHNFLGLVIYRSL